MAEYFGDSSHLLSLVGLGINPEVIFTTLLFLLYLLFLLFLNKVELSSDYRVALLPNHKNLYCSFLKGTCSVKQPNCHRH